MKIIEKIRQNLTNILILTPILVLISSCNKEFKNSYETTNVDTSISIGHRINLSSETLGEERELFIALPNNYDQNIHSYPVIFVFDAEYLFEITTSIVKLKVSRNEMPESIIVGIPNTEDGRYDMAMELIYEDGKTFFGDAKGEKIKDYLDFIQNDITKYLNENYRINNHHSVIGMSPTFGPVLEAFWNRSGLFDGHIVLASEIAVRTNTGETVEERLLKTISDTKAPKSSIYIGKASEDLKRRPEEELLAYSRLNENLKMIDDNAINYTIEILENENHYGMAIRGIEHGLETIYPTKTWSIPYRDFWQSDNPAEAIKAFYENLSNQYGFDVIPLEDSFYFIQTLSGSVRRFYRQEKFKEASAIVELGLQYYPNSETLKKWQTKLKK